jgi:hypothetical protein
MQGFSGSLSDKLQKRKAIALAGYLLAAIAKPLIGLSIVWQGVSGARVFDRRLPSFSNSRRLVASSGTICPGLGEAIYEASSHRVAECDHLVGTERQCWRDVSASGAGGQFFTDHPRIRSAAAAHLC